MPRAFKPANIKKEKDDGSTQDVRRMDSKMEDIQFMDGGLPAELNNLRTAELINGFSISNFPSMIFSNSDNEAFGDPLVADNGLEYPMANMEAAPELPNSTVSNPPPATCTLPCTEDFQGSYGFDICYDALIGPAGSSNSWAYSEGLKTVFIKMSNVLMVQFKTKKPLEENQFYIRGLLVYQNNDFINQAVSRCSIHSMEDDPGQNSHKVPGQCNCDHYGHAGHVLRCHTEGAIYQYDANSERHSVLVSVPPAPMAGSNFLKAAHYFFTCKTSCPRGMQRRAVQMIFTLEDDRGAVYGRKVLPVKICSCPKRDKDRQEKDCKASEEVLDRKPPKRQRTMTAGEDIKPAKTEMDHQIFLMQIREATRESLDIYLKDLVQKQSKDLATLKQQASDMRKLNAKIVDITAQIADLHTAVETTERAMRIRQNDIQEIVQRLGQNRHPI